MIYAYRTLSRLVLVLPFLWVATTQAAENRKEPVAAIEMEATSFAVGVGYTWGNGKLWFKEKEYTFSVSGLSLVGVGISTVKAKGDVLHLKDLADFSGTYVGFSAGGALGKGGGGLTMKNEKGVVINVVTVQEGLKLSIGPSGFAIKLKD
ncbi:MAG: hypothetical protein O6948_13995 [Deltaproteobacteria bacterium]|nr:hypothetical protein [Deltaproteobacteria bacterium]